VISGWNSEGAGKLWYQNSTECGVAPIANESPATMLRARQFKISNLHE